MQVELAEVQPGKPQRREPARPRMDFTEAENGHMQRLPDISAGTTEVLSLRRDAQPLGALPPEADGGGAAGAGASAGTSEGGGEFLLDRRDVWAADGWDTRSGAFQRP